MFSSFPLGWKKLDPVEGGSLTKHLNQAKVVVVTTTLVHHAETMVVEVELVSGTGQL